MPCPLKGFRRMFIDPKSNGVVVICPVGQLSVGQMSNRCNSQKYTYMQNYTPGIFSHTKISQKHTGGMFSRQAIRNG